MQRPGGGCLAAIVFASLFVVSFFCVLLVYVFSNGAPMGSGPPDKSPLKVVLAFVPLVTAFFSAIGTVFSVVLGWRSDRRSNTELKMKIAQLEQNLAKPRD